ncbi:MAG TPA: DNRLRE domain-containing protein, partial [Streptosporangiaceae bacterium]|nr:DNRLRE domain-containing protein [Streptosporangiaceae bacterium]
MPESRRTRLLAAGTAVCVCAAMSLVAVELTTGGSSGPPSQQAGTAAGRPHRVPASATIARLAGGRVVRSGARGVPRTRTGVSAEVAAAEAKATLPASRRPKGALPASAPAPRLKFPVRGRAPKPEQAKVLRAPAAKAKPGYSAKTSRVLSGQTSSNQVVYQNADGTRTAMVYQSPEFYRRADGTWATISTDLVPATVAANGVMAPSAVTARPLATASPSPMVSPSPSPSPSPTPSPSLVPPASPSPSAPASTPASAPDGWRVKAAASEESFAPYADAGTLVNLPLGGGQAVGFGVNGAAHAAGSASGDTVTYPGALPDSDLRYLAGSGLVTERLILDSRGAASSYVFPLTLTGGVSAVQKPGGPVEFTDGAGQVVAVVEPGYMTDSGIGPHSGDGAYSAGVTYTLVKQSGRSAIRMTLDTAWLDASARVFPVTVDPSVSDVNANGTTYVESPGSSDYSSDTEIKVGTYDGGSNVAKSFLKFDNISSNLKNDYVLGARLGVFNSWSYSCSPRSVSVYPVTSSWSVSGSKSYPGPSTGKALASKSFATGWVALGNPQSDSPCPNQWEGFNLGTAGNALLNGWTHGTTANNGLALGASSSDSYGWKKFTSDNSSGGDPFLAVTYSTDGASYSLVSKTPVQQVSPTANGMIAIRVTNLGSTTWTPTNGYELSYEVYNAKGQRVPVSPQAFTPMPSTVAPNQSVIVNAKVNELPVGSYAINFDMYKNATGSSPVSFLSEGIQPFAVGLYVPQPPPVVSGVYPPNGYSTPTDTPQLATTAFSTTNTTITYNFTLTCDPLPGTVCPASTVSSGTVYTPYWTVSPALDWDEPYTWTVTATTNGASTTVGPVSITPQVPQPDISSQLGQSGGPAQSGGSSGEPFDPESGNYSTSATD